MRLDLTTAVVGADCASFRAVPAAQGSRPCRFRAYYTQLPAAMPSSPPVPRPVLLSGMKSPQCVWVLELGLVLPANKDAVAAAAAVQYLWDRRYIDAAVLRWRDADGLSGNGLEETLYFCNDANMNVTAVVGQVQQGNPPAATWKVLERYVYDAYGNLSVRSEAWAALPASAVANEVLYCGYRHDAETGLYHVRHRYYACSLGIWTTRDPAGYVDGVNLCEYVRSGPLLHNDPSGTTVDPDRIIGPAEASLEVAVFEKGYRDDPFYHDRRTSFFLNHEVLFGLGWKKFCPGGTSKGRNGFVFTCKWGFVDLGHFFINASWHYFHENTDNAAHAGRRMEKFQDWLRRHGGYGDMGDSAFTPEDLNSNIQGALFGQALGKTDKAMRIAQAQAAMDEFNRLPSGQKVPYLMALSRKPIDYALIAPRFTRWLVDNGAVKFDDKGYVKGLLMEEAGSWIGSDGKVKSELRFKEPIDALKFMRSSRAWKCLCNPITLKAKPDYQYTV